MPNRAFTMISKIRAFMKHLYSVLLIAALALAGASVHAERADRDKPLTIDADAWRLGVSWVPQRPHLLAGTIADAIRKLAKE